MKNRVLSAAILSLLAGSSTLAFAHSDASCKSLPSYEQLKTALTQARGDTNGGFDLDMWGTVVNRDGVVCAVAFTGGHRGDQWPGSRVISAQKANTANSFSLPNLALSTANLYTAVQPGGSLFGLQESNPVETIVAYKGPSSQYGQAKDPMVGYKIGGVNVFGGGLALYDSKGNLLGGIGVSGDSSCADHNIAWRTRNLLALDFVPAGVAALFSGDSAHPDNIVYDITSQAGQMPGVSEKGWGHPACNDTVADIAKNLPATQK